MRLIDADAANVEEISCYYGNQCYTEDVQEWLNEQPTIEAEPVVHGRWDQARYTEAPLYICSRCDKPEYKQHNYCPNCGAIMGGRRKRCLRTQVNSSPGQAYAMVAEELAWAW